MTPRIKSITLIAERTSGAGAATLDLVWGVIDFTPDTDFPSPRAKNIVASPLTGGVGVSCPRSFLWVVEPPV